MAKLGSQQKRNEPDRAAYWYAHANEPCFSGFTCASTSQTYRGISLTSKDIKDFDLQAAYLDKVNHRDSTNYEKIKISGVNGRFKSAETDGLYYLGGNYQFNPALKLTAFTWTLTIFITKLWSVLYTNIKLMTPLTLARNYVTTAAEMTDKQKQA